MVQLHPLQDMCYKVAELNSNVERVEGMNYDQGWKVYAFAAPFAPPEQARPVPGSLPKFTVNALTV